MYFPTLFHTASALSAPSGHLPLEGKAFGAGAAVFSFRRLLHGGKDFGLLPPSFGRRCPEGAEVGSRSGMRRKVRQPILPFRHPERSRGIFLVAAVYDMHTAAQKIARALISHSPFHRCARKISRFARNDDAGKALGVGQRYSRFAAFSMAGRILDFSLLPLEGGRRGRRLAPAAG